jgi:hypothetical protein
MMRSKFGRLIVGLEPVVYLAFGVYAGVAFDGIVGTLLVARSRSR